MALLAIGRVLPVILAGLAVTACGSSTSRLVTEAPARFAGMERQGLSACAGPPTAVEQTAAGTVLHYEMRSARQVEIPRPDPGPGRVGSASSALPPPPSVTYSRDCSARFVIRDGRVADAVFQGRGSGGDPSPSACEAFVRRCLRGG